MNWFLFCISPDSMGDDGTMAKGTRYTPEFKAKAVRLLTESRGSCSSETNAIEQVAKDPGIRRNHCGVGATRRTRRSRRDQTVGGGRDGGSSRV